MMFDHSCNNSRSWMFRVFLLALAAVAAHASRCSSERLGRETKQRQQELDQLRRTLPDGHNPYTETVHTIVDNNRPIVCRSTTVYYKKGDADDTYLVEFKVVPKPTPEPAPVALQQHRKPSTTPEVLKNPFNEPLKNSGEMCSLTVDFSPNKTRKSFKGEDGYIWRDASSFMKLPGKVEDRIRGDGWFSMTGLPEFIEDNPMFTDKKWNGAYQKMLNPDETEFALLNFITLKNGDMRWDLDYWYKGNDFGSLTPQGEWHYKMLYSSSKFKNGVPRANYLQQDLGNKSNDVVFWKQTRFLRSNESRGKDFCARESGKDKNPSKERNWSSYAATSHCRIYKNGMPKKKVNAQVPKDGEKMSYRYTYRDFFWEQVDNGAMITVSQPDLQVGDVITRVNRVSLAGLPPKKTDEVLRQEMGRDGVVFEVERHNFIE